MAIQMLELLLALGAAGSAWAAQTPMLGTAEDACPDYATYSKHPHPPFAKGSMQLPFQRPAVRCRTFTSAAVEHVIDSMKADMIDDDLARIFENAFPNTLDTTVRWHINGSDDYEESLYYNGRWAGPQSFIVTGDINAEWLRDSTNQLAQYQVLSKKDSAISTLIHGAINTQAEYVIQSPYCNAFQPPPPSRLAPSNNGQGDAVHPAYEPDVVFECKYELDSLANFLALGNQYYNHTQSTAFVTPRWLQAVETVLVVLDEQERGTFDPTSGAFERNEYRFQRQTNAGTETLSLSGIGNPLSNGTGLIRSAFRPSDDASILGFLVPANAMMAVELTRTGKMLQQHAKRASTAAANDIAELAEHLLARGKALERAVWTHAVVPHKVYGDVFAYEVDGYGSAIFMDDANQPSLLALPLLGFCSAADPIYRNTRRMILSKQGNPYYLAGTSFRGIGGPHIGPTHAWPMSLLVQAMTSDDDDEIIDLLALVKRASRLGLVHESINVNLLRDYTRSWFAWANSVFAQTILDLAQRKPHLLFGKGAKPRSFA